MAQTARKQTKLEAVDKKKLREAFEAQRTAFLENPDPSLRERRADLATLKRMLSENRETIIEAINQDFGNRSWHESTFAEFLAVFGQIDFLSKNLKDWIKPQPRHVDRSLFGIAKNYVKPQPLGVVGIIVPWNFPINLSFIPIATAFAAGNRAMVKMSENSPALAKLLVQLRPRYFAKEKLTFFEETGGVGIEFSKIPFDLILFTGSPETGKAVMASAARNLTPVILELGGKCPAIVDRDFPVEKAAERIMYAKQMNAGQVCLNVDYAFIHESRKQAFIDQATAAAQKLVPDIDSSDYTSIIDDKSFQRLQGTLEDARKKGAKVIQCHQQDPNAADRKMPIFIVTDTTPDMEIRNREIFGPILMLLTYRNDDEVKAFINSGDRPLALYVFSHDKKLADDYLSSTMSGGACINETMFHAFQDDMPFGGVGNSGMGHYHGREGFDSFSKLRPVFHQAKVNAASLLNPPYGEAITRAYSLLAKLKG